MSIGTKLFLVFDIFYFIVLWYTTRICNTLWESDVERMFKEADKTFISIVSYSTMIFLSQFIYFVFAIISYGHF